jgi:hypothetical protein
VRMWDGPGGPRNGFGTGVGEFLRGGAESFANRIPPNVAGDVFGGVGVAKNVVVVAHFPQAVRSSAVKSKGGAGFEGADEFLQVRERLSALNEKMQMIGHEAIGMENEAVLPGRFQK